MSTGSPGTSLAGGAVRLEHGFTREITKQPEPIVHREGPTITDEQYQAYLQKLAAHPLLTEENITVDRSKATARGVPLVLAGLGAIAATFALGVPALNLKHALAAYQVGVFTMLAICLGSMFLVMLFHIFNTTWSVTIRRVLERSMSLIWLPLLLLVPVVLIEFGSAINGDGVLFSWLREDMQGNFILEKKSAYLNPTAFTIRFAFIYLPSWLILSRVFMSLSERQDFTGDRMLTSKMRRASAFGLLVFALTTAFFAFDFLMSLDFRFFSTMWGVYYFAGAAMSGVAIAALTLSVLRAGGKLTGIVTKEHFHDLGKLLFAFMVFWAYISFSQYFLIWYSNIPEETIFMLERTTGDWKPLYLILAIGHFVAPFPFLISRNVKKSTLGLGVMAAYLLLMQVLDMVWVVRPMVYLGIEGASTGGPGIAGWWLDVIAVGGVLLLFAGAFIRSLAGGPLIPTRDPRLGAALAHHNYV